MRFTAPCVVAILIVLGVVGAAAAAVVPAPARGRVIVRYRDLNACGECLMARRAPFAPFVGDPSLDDVHARLGVTAMRPLFAEGAARGRAAHASRLAGVRARFPQRSARIPA